MQFCKPSTLFTVLRDTVVGIEVGTTKMSFQSLQHLRTFYVCKNFVSQNFSGNFFIFIHVHFVFGCTGKKFGQGAEEAFFHPINSQVLYILLGKKWKKNASANFNLNDCKSGTYVNSSA
jgi:hypothetical protein